MVSLVFLALGLGADSFRVSTAFAALGSRRRLRIVLTFGVCDGLATAAGLAYGWSLESVLHRRATIVGSIVVGLYGLLVIRRTLSRGTPDSTCRAVETAIPLALSLDNLGAGVALGTLGYPILPCAVLFGLSSAAMSFAGLCVGHVIVRHLPLTAQRAQLSGAVALTLLAAASGLGLL
jgi:manganese efflux pump family protein